ncbi:MAG: HU family DNA-binding protein [Bacteroidales bacterium]|nr:HU family DNA-binding protein [Bacteroidales bacterium]MDD2612337.1 HU family DNA-binding protein [Bacteroidales bacterium]MDD4713333.1 HU family DNA-binding protein [Bacteroidales bacterium]
MKTKDFVQKIQHNITVNPERSAELVELTTSIIARILGDGDALAIKGFGTFEVKKKEERVSVNPVTGNRWMIPPKLVPSFKPGTTLKEKIKTYSGHEQ